MNASSLRYLTRQGLNNLKVNKLMTFASIVVLVTCLFITGVAYLFTANLDSVVNYLGTKNETVVFLDPTLDEQQENDRIYKEITAIDGVSQVTLMTKEEVLEYYRSYLDGYEHLWERFETDNPFKANYRVTIADLENMDAILEKLAKVNGVVKVSAPVEMVGVFVQVQKVVSYAGSFLVAALALVSLVVISNTVRLTVFARRKEINIMKYVGATNSFIRWPFFVEGVVVGFISSLISSGLSLLVYYVVLRTGGSLTGLWENVLGQSALPLAAVALPLVSVSIPIGVLVGGMGSVLSIRKHLKV